MPRANRHYVPGGVWHITHRCHNMDFLLISNATGCVALAIPGPETIWLVRVELHRNVQPLSLAGPGWPTGIHIEKHAIDIGSNSALGRFADQKTFASRHREWVESSLSEQKTEREPAWSESIAVGPKSFVVEMQARLGMQALYRPIRIASADTFVIEDA